jgi:hypothetical protein
VRAFVLSLSLLSVLAPSALAKPQPREIGEVPLPSSDGTRFATWSDGSTVRVIDTRERRSFLVEVPTGCFYRAVGGRELLFSCETSPASERPYGPRYLPFLYSIDQAEFHWPARVETLLGRQGEYGLSFSDVGRHWIAYETYDGYHVTTDYLYEWHTGVSEDRDDKETSRQRRVIDLDEHDALTKLCRPLHLDSNPGYLPGDPEDPPNFDYAYVYPFGLGELGGYDAAPVYLQRCGSQKQLRLTESTYVSGLTRRVAYWTEELTLHILILRSGRKLVYDFSSRPPDSSGISAVGTTRRLYVTTGSSDDETTSYVLRTPRR